MSNKNLYSNCTASSHCQSLFNNRLQGLH